jgi:hypothetical protein
LLPPVTIAALPPSPSSIVDNLSPPSSHRTAASVNPP